MLDSETLEKLQNASISERIAIIEMILRSLKHEMRSAGGESIAQNRPLRGKVRYYKDPYEPVATEDWEALA